MKRITLDELEKREKAVDYHGLYEAVISLIESGQIKPIKASGFNGKKPALYKEYKIVEIEKDFSQYEEEISYLLVSMISTDYYLHHLKQYEEDRKWILLLNDFLKSNRQKLQVPKSLNERSFEIWHREKFLKEEDGKKVLKRCGMTLEQLNVYETTEPLAYYVHTRNIPQNMLLLENKDTFYSLRKRMLSENNCFLQMEFGTIIYGAGKGIYRSFQDFSICAEPYMKDKGNSLYYLGDLDYEGILIFETLVERFAGGVLICPFVQGYLAMLQKAETLGFEKLPEMKEGQNRNVGNLFYSYFTEEYLKKLQKLLEMGRYIPQEILSEEDF